MRIGAESSLNGLKWSRFCSFYGQFSSFELLSYQHRSEILNSIVTEFIISRHARLQGLVPMDLHEFEANQV